MAGNINYLPRILALTLLLLGSFSNALPKTGLQGKRVERLSRDFEVEWQANFGERTIDFWISAATPGFVAFGLSNRGIIDGADIVVGGVKDGNAYFQDFHGEGDIPVVDEKQDWDIENITETDGHTLMHLKRKFDTNDEDDVTVTSGTTKLFWALGADEEINFEGVNHGFFPVNLLDPPTPTVDMSTFKVYDIKSTINVTSETETVYWCSVHKRAATNKTHITAFTPKLDSPAAKKHTHHINIYACKPHPELVPNPDEFFGRLVDHPGQDCVGSLIQEMLMHCNDDIYAWSLGGRALVFPESVGFPWGFDENEYFIAQYHVDNSEKADVVFESGVTIYHTENLRNHSAGLMSVSYGTASIIIPPEATDYTLPGYCGSQYTKAYLPEHGIHMINVNMHAHASATKMSLRHFREGEEQPRIILDETYDFRYQENRPLYKPRKVLRGDELTIDCTYDTTWKNPPGTVIGGMGSYDEMCMAFIYYYPRTPLRTCDSAANIDEILRKEFGIVAPSFATGTLDLVIDEPELWENRTLTDVLSNEILWTDTKRSILESQFKKRKNHEQICSLNSLDFTGHQRGHAEDEENTNGGAEPEAVLHADHDPALHKSRKTHHHKHHKGHKAEHGREIDLEQPEDNEIHDEHHHKSKPGREIGETRHAADHEKKHHRGHKTEKHNRGHHHHHHAKHHKGHKGKHHKNRKHEQEDQDDADYEFDLPQHHNKGHHKHHGDEEHHKENKESHHNKKHNNKGHGQKHRHHRRHHKKQQEAQDD